MKFLAIALATLLGASEAAPSGSRGTVRRGLDKRKIMEKAVRVDRDGNRILAEEEFEMSGAYSLRFDTCVSLKTQPADADILFGENIISYTSKGNVVSQKSYILFSVCESKYCSYYAEGDNLFMVDIATYMSAITEYYQGKEENGYCDACAENENYCAYLETIADGSYSGQYNPYQNANQGQNVYQQADGEDEGSGDQDGNQEGEEDQNNNQYQNANQYQQADENNDAGRRLAWYGNYEVVDCSTCADMGCFNNNQYQNAEQNVNYNYDDAAADDGYVYDEDDMIEWISGISQCQYTDGLFLNYYPMYAGFMCNQDGSGVDIAMFLDEDCSIYSSTSKFVDSASEKDQSIMYQAADIVQGPFLNDINCNGNIEYISYATYTQLVKNYNPEEQEEEDEGEVSEFCQALFDGNDDWEGAISLRDCDADGEEDEAEGEGDEDAYVDNYYSYEYYWYTYVLSYEASQSTSAVCEIVRDMNGEYQYLYKWNGSGQIYDYGTSAQNRKTDNVKEFFSGYDALDVLLIIAISSAVLVAMVASCCLMCSCCCAHRKKKATKYADHRKELDSKRERLVDETTGKLM